MTIQIYKLTKVNQPCNIIKYVFENKIKSMINTILLNLARIESNDILLHKTHRRYNINVYSNENP